MKKTYDGILFDEYGESIPLSTDEFIEYLIWSLNQLESEKHALERQISDIHMILNPVSDANDI